MCIKLGYPPIFPVAPHAQGILQHLCKPSRPLPQHPQEKSGLLRVPSPLLLLIFPGLSPVSSSKTSARLSSSFFPCPLTHPCRNGENPTTFPLSSLIRSPHPAMRNGPVPRASVRMPTPTPPPAPPPSLSIPNAPTMPFPSPAPPRTSPRKIDTSD